MNFTEFTKFLERTARPVVLVEGTRSLPEEIKPKMKAVARMMSEDLPHLVFRTGNAPGADETFAAGVVGVDPNRLEVVLPYAGHRKKQAHPESRLIALEQIPEIEKTRLCELTVRATPSVRGLIDLYQKNAKRNRNTVKAFYLVRDTLKVAGSAYLDLASAGKLEFR